jgi:phosphate transport system protein
MERHFDVYLRELKGQLISMAGLVEKAIETAILGLQTNDPGKFTEVDQIETKINHCHISVDEACLRLLALQQPLATDLRLIVAILKINTDLERMGDQAVNIARNAEHYIAGKPVKPLIDLPLMFDEVRVMVRKALDSFVRQDQSLAREVLQSDDAVDSLKHKIFMSVLDRLKKSPDLFEQGIELILIARNLERIGDHATNIAEDVIFAITGEDVRHSGKKENLKKALS